MNKKVLYYYGLLAIALCVQGVATVFTLSQNIGYGQKISLLEERKAAITQEMRQQQLQGAEQLALRQLSESEANSYQNISQVILVQRHNVTLASR